MPNKPEPDVMFDYAVALYKAMKSEAKGNTYTGKVVGTFGSLGISMSHYSTLFNSLKELGCIELLERGVRNRPTVYRLHHAPTREAYDKLYDGGLTRAEKPATIPTSELDKRISDIERRLKGLDLKQMFKNHEERLVTLEKGGSK